MIDTVYSAIPTKRFITQIFAYDINCDKNEKEYCISIGKFINGECVETQKIVYGEIKDLEENRIILCFSNNFNQDMSVDSFVISFPSGIHLHDMGGLYGIGECDNLIKGNVVLLKENVDTPVLSIQFTPSDANESDVLQYVISLSVVA